MVSCIALIGFACGDDAGGGNDDLDGDGAVDAGEDDSGSIDGRPDGGGSSEDAGRDASPDDASVGDASPGTDAEVIECESQGGCTAAGIICTADGAVTCGAIPGGCFAPVGAPDPCNAEGHEVCRSGIGCVCDEDPACGLLDGSGANGAGTYCEGTGAVVECAADAVTGCVFQVATANTRQCAFPLACDGEPGAADCVCPAADPAARVPGSGCVTTERLCADDSSSIIVCQAIDAIDQDDVVTCQVWDDGLLVPDDPVDPDDYAGDDCRSDGLTCPAGGNPQCVCPPNGTSDFYVNAHPTTQLRRWLPGRAGLVQNGRRRPTICSFDSVTVGLENAMIAIGPGHAGRSRVILDNEDDPIGSIDSLVPSVGGKVRVVFENEHFPWVVPSKVEIITVDRASAGAPPGTALDPDHFTVVVDNFDNDAVNDSGYGAAVNVLDSGLISGFTLIEGGCDIREPDTQERDGSLDDYCYDRYEDWPNVMVQVLDRDGIRNPVTRTIEAMHISGAGGPVPDDTFGPEDLPSGGVFTRDDETGVVTFTPDDGDFLEDLVDVIDGNGATVFLAFFEETIVPGTRAATGSFGPVSVSYDEDFDPVGLQWYDPRGPGGVYAGRWSYVLHEEFEATLDHQEHGNRKTIDVGILVGRDDLQGLDRGLPEDPEFGDTNAELHDVRVTHFASRLDSQADMSRYGVIVDDDYPGTSPFIPDAVSFFGGLLLGNDTGMLVSDGNVRIGPTANSVVANSPGDQGHLEIAGSSGQGLEVYDRNDEWNEFEPYAFHVTTVWAESVYVHHTQFGDPDVFATRDRFAYLYGVPGPSLDEFDQAAPYDDLNGNGINVTGPGYWDDGPQLNLGSGRVSANAANGLSVVNTANADLEGSFALVMASETRFDGNGADGVRVKYGADVTLFGIESSNNYDNGVHIETSVRGQLDEVWGRGIVEILGGRIHGNGHFAVDRGGHGILAQGSNLVVTDAFSDASNLLVENNGFGGLYADNGYLLVSNTTFRRNGVNDLCLEDDLEGHFMQVTITADDGYYDRDLNEERTEARMSMVSSQVVEGYGGGIEIDSGAEASGLNPLGLENLIESSRIAYNEGVRDCDSEDNDDVFDDFDEPAPTDDGDSGVDADFSAYGGDQDREYAERDGIEVTRQGRLFFVNAPSVVESNGKNPLGLVISDGVDGIEVAGQLPLPPLEVGDRTSVIVRNNSGDGITVACGPTSVDQPVSVCGFAQLRGGASTDNDHNGAVTHGHLFWQGSTIEPALIDNNGDNGVYVDHAASTDIDDADCDPITFGTQPCDLAEDAGDAPDLSHALGWADSANFRAGIRTELLDVTIAENGENGVRIDSAPFAIEPDAQGNGCLTRAGEPLALLTGPVMDSEIEDADPVCEHATGFRIHSTNSSGRSTVKYNQGWAFVIGTDNQQQNVYALVSDVQMYENLLGGVDVHQNTAYGTFACDDQGSPVECRCDDTDLPYVGPSPEAETVGCTATTILSNNIFNNGGPGMFIRRSQQKPTPSDDRRVISANDIHHNAIAGNACTPADAQSYSQVHFEGKIILSDPSSAGAGVMDGSHPADLMCYVGADVSDPPHVEAECDRMNDPEDPLSGGINNHCVWNGTQCRVGWDMAGTVSACGTADNRIFAYVNDVAGSAYTQKGVVADDGALVLARRNTWGIGGALNGAHAVSGTSSEVDVDDACGAISTCTGPSPE